MSVKEAAERLGIGRPALSNFLNGNASLSPEMAVRLEKAFGADQAELLEMQAEYNQQERRSAEKHVAVRAFVPSFLTIKARQIEDWAEHRIEARAHLPVLLRRLVHSTGSDLRRVDFPGYDNSQRKGSDGLVEAGAATPWVPEGKSYWEFGTNERSGTKAESDYSDRLTSVDAAERARSTFIFVTPRNWPGKVGWEQRKNEVSDWKSVRAFDASDLEQWLDQSVPAQIWLAEQLDLPVDGCETLECVWRKWVSVTQPQLTTEVFAQAVAAYRNKLKCWLNKPSDRPFVVSADSRGEALAFLACLLNDSDLRQFRDLAAVFNAPATLRKLAASSVPFIPIVPSEEAERELADAHRRLHCIVFRPRNAVDIEPDITLDLLSYDALKEALVSIGIEDDEVERLARESGHSPTILRRRLSQNLAIRSPAWASDDSTAATLGPIALVGAWHAEPEADREIVSYVSDQQYEAVEGNLARLLRFDDSPTWSSGRYRGVVSKIDALFAVARMITLPDLDRFFDAAEYVLSESDPALELPEEDRWAAPLHGKNRDHSGALRKSLCETLVLLSVHGNNLFRSRLGIEVDSRIAILIRKLLTPVTLERLLSSNHDLPLYAEAAPDEFLRVIEEDLQSDSPVVFGLLKPVDSGAFGARPSRTGLLWALECLAWKPQNLPRVTTILGRLSRLKIDDNWINKPVASLQAIFRSWMPQTAASVEQRSKALELLNQRFPRAGWAICIDQIKPGPRTGHFNYRPRWRGDASGAGQVVTHKEMYEFTAKALGFLLAWSSHDEKTLGSLAATLQGVSEEDQIKVWNLVDRWAGTAPEDAKAELRESIRRFALVPCNRRRQLPEAARDRARKVYISLRPQDPVVRHAWLFVDQWVQESSGEIADEHFNYRMRDERIDRLRREGMAEIWTEHGFDGVAGLLADSNAACTVGHYVASCVDGLILQVEFVRRCLRLGGDLESKATWCLQGFFQAIEQETYPDLLLTAANGLSTEENVRLFACAPFQESTWRLLDSYSEDVRVGYWEEVAPSWQQHTIAELTELVDRLLEVGRPRAAFHSVHMNFDDVETSRLKRLLLDIVQAPLERPGPFKLGRYYISKAISSLDGRPGTTREELAQLELFYLGALDFGSHGIPNLESLIAESPVTFVRAIAFAYKRRNRGEDPPELRVDDPERRQAAASAAYRLLHKVKRIPGTNESGLIDAAKLGTWLAEARRLCLELDREVMADQCIGQLLANAPEDDDGSWPCKAVCAAVEEIASVEIGRGFYLGVLSSRGVTYRGDGGDQERELAAKYRARADLLHFDYPYVGGLLEDIARSYDREAEQWDTEAETRKRLRD